MTLGALGKLGLRLISLHLLLFYTLPWLPFTRFSAATVDNLPRMTLEIQLVAAFITALVLWFGADRMVMHLLPARAPKELGPDYERFERLSLMAVGGLLCLDGLYWLVDIAISRDPSRTIQAVVSLVIGLSLIFGRVVMRIIPMHHKNS